MADFLDEVTGDSLSFGMVGNIWYRFTLCTVGRRSTEDGYPHIDFGAKEYVVMSCS